MDYEGYTLTIKALSDPNRVKILDMLSCGQMCACDILEHFDFTQPTLSHHMKVLMKAELVNSKKEGIWNYYSINALKATQLTQDTRNLFTHDEDCVCYEPTCSDKKNVHKNKEKTTKR